MSKKRNLVFHFINLLIPIILQTNKEKKKTIELAAHSNLSLLQEKTSNKKSENALNSVNCILYGLKERGKTGRLKRKF